MRDTGNGMSVVAIATTACSSEGSNPMATNHLAHQEKNRKGKIMIEYSKTNRGDILRIVGAGAPGFAPNGSLVRVLERTLNGVKVENPHGSVCEFMFNCGAARLEPTEWKNDFPADGAVNETENPT
jgi:hypothetical protein